MKKNLLFLICLLFCSSIAQALDKGDNVVSLGLGAGIIVSPDGKESKMDYHGKLAFEHGIADGLFGGKFSLGIGVSAINSITEKAEGTVIGTYDYSYHWVKYERNKYGSNKYLESGDKQRTGQGTADADSYRDDVSLMLQLSLHYNVSDKLDTYLSIGGGGCAIIPVFANIHNEKGFAKMDHDEYDARLGWGMQYSFNDLDHVKWDGGDTKFAPSASAFIGARYYFSSHWAAQIEAGLVGMNIKKSFGHVYNLGSIGVCYKF